MQVDRRSSGVELLGDISWGTHFCQFYETKEDLLDILVPYFKAGLESNEFCMWITVEPLDCNSAMSALRKELKDLDRYIERGQLEILDYRQWYIRSGEFDADEVLQGWVEKEKAAVEKGFDGLRLTGNTFWLEEKDWTDFTEYEEVVNNVIGNYRMLAICCYSLEKCQAADIIDVVNNHQFALIRRADDWAIMESSERKQAEEDLKESEKKYRSLVESTDDAVYLIGQDMRYEFANRKYLSRLDLSLTELVGQEYGKLHPSDTSEGFAKKVGQVIKSGEPMTYEHLSQRDNKYFMRTLSPVTGEEPGEIKAITVTSKDINELKQAEEALKESEKRLEKQNELLSDKNAALREMIRQIDDEKNQVKNKILANVEQLIMPIIVRLRRMEVPIDRMYIDLLEESLNNIVSGFSYELYKSSSALSSREIEIGNMIKNGLTTKEIARMLNLSIRTIDTHRNNIRKKLRIQNKNINLTSYLKSL